MQRTAPHTAPLHIPEGAQSTSTLPDSAADRKEILPLDFHARPLRKWNSIARTLDSWLGDGVADHSGTRTSPRGHHEGGKFHHGSLEGIVDKTH